MNFYCLTTCKLNRSLNVNTCVYGYNCRRVLDKIASLVARVSIVNTENQINILFSLTIDDIDPKTIDPH